MKRISAITLFTIGAIATAAGLVAQQPAVKADIPFNFIAGEKSMPAGEYTISSPNWPIVKIQSADKRIVELVISSRSYHAPAASPQLVFEKCGEFYFLHRVLSPANTSLDLDIASGKAEKRVRTREAKLQTEKEILVAAR
jgi:hypothetical protein